MTFPDGVHVKTHTFQNGGEIIKVSFDMDKFTAFAEQHKHNGWLNLEIKTSAKTGNRYICLDEFKKKEGLSAEYTQEQAGKDVVSQMPERETAENNDDSLPF